MDPDVAQRIGAIAADHRSGATTIAAQAAAVYALAAATSRTPRPAQFLADMAEAGRFLMAAQPAMAPLARLANDVLHAADVSPVEGQREAVAAVARSFTARAASAAPALATAGASLIPSGAVVVTHSASSAVEGALHRAQAERHLARVIVSESRPLMEGVAQAARLAAAGIAVTLVADALAPALVAEADVLLVGADTVAPQGIINKAGTFALALAAQAANVPLLVVAGSEKLLPAALFDTQRALTEERDPGELLATPLPGVTILNRAFDFTPLDLVTSVVTEAGALSAAAVIAACASIVVHAALLE